MQADMMQVKADVKNLQWLMARVDVDNLTTEKLEDVAASCAVLLRELAKVGVEV